MTLAGYFGNPNASSRSLAAVLSAQGADPKPGRSWSGDSAAFAVARPGRLAVLGSTLALAGEIRLDDRPGLLRALGASLAEPPDACVPEPATDDATLLLHAYRCWGPDFLDRVDGAVACAVWDGAAHRLVLARDACCPYSLFYTRTDDGWRFASLLSGLLCQPDQPMALDERALADRLIEPNLVGSETLYRGICRVQPGHAVILAAKARDGWPEAREIRHWHPERLTPLHLASPDDYAEAMGQALDTAVRCRLPATGSVACELSGGLDSPAVTSLAARALAEQGRRLVAYTGVPARPVDPLAYPGRNCDEGELAGAVAALYPNIEHVQVAGAAGELFADAGLRQAVLGELEPFSPNSGWVAPILRDVRRRGITVILAAGGGNFSFSYDGVCHLSELVRHGKLAKLARTLHQIRRYDPQRTWPVLLRQTFAPWLPVAWVESARRALGRPPAFDPWRDGILNPVFARRMGLDHTPQWAGETSGATGGDGPALRARLLGDCGITTGLRNATGIELHDPTLDRRVVELSLRIPEEQFLYAGQPRALARRLLRGLVPDSLLQRTDSGLQSADWPDRLNEARAEIEAEIAWMEGSELARCYLDVPKLRGLIERWPQGGDHEWARVRNDYGATLMMGLGAARLLRRFDPSNR
jgi:asparagine synthase (glutamine-hydrolysing)